MRALVWFGLFSIGAFVDAVFGIIPPTFSVIFIEPKCTPHMEHQPSVKLRPDRSAFADTTAGQENARSKVMGISGKPDDDDGFAALAQLESHPLAFGSPPQSLGEDGKDDDEEA